ncbi:MULTISPECIES: type III-B CRISPR module RAMP protein Cmr6 [Clostridia]|uniref:type III-B CRISPR module RAMP protein Cmr6 n=1 Tax=Clostridia TaxID=186801 RepID=UPI0011C212F0|nr:type III-B CRISPR module RAMP protein Cmr6 [Clostridium sp. 1xD42-85]
MSKNNNVQVPSYIAGVMNKSKHLYSNFYRYSYMKYKTEKTEKTDKTDKKKGKLKPKLNNEPLKNDQPILSNMKEKRKQFIQSCPCFIAMEYKADKLIIGGVPSPYTGDTMTALHSIYGVPYIEGSSIKGLLRHCIMQEEANAIEQEWFQVAFGVGSDDKENPFGRGNLVFFDSFPESTFTLERDIQAPHYVDYYQSEGETLPTDDMSPKLFEFYVVKETTFTIIIGVLEKSKDVMETIKKYLKIALEDYGLGGKTAVGYGLAVEVNDVTQRLQEQLRRIQQEKQQKERKEQQLKEEERLAKLPPIEQLHARLDRLTESNSDMECSKKDIYEKVLEHASEDPSLAQKLLQYWEKYDSSKSKKQKEKLEKLEQFL